jgi:hypothetical protein
MPNWGALAHEDFDPRRLFRHVADASLLPKTQGSRGYGLERPRAGYRRARCPTEGHRMPGAHPRAHENSSRPARTPPQTQAHQPTQCLSAHRRRRLYAPRHYRIVEPTSRHAVLCCGRAHMGAHSRGGASASAADGGAQSRQVANRRRYDVAQKDARHFRLRPHRRDGRGLWQGVRHERGGVGARGIARAGARGRIRDRAQQGGILRDLRCRCTCAWCRRRVTSSKPRIWPA